MSSAYRLFPRTEPTCRRRGHDHDGPSDPRPREQPVLDCLSERRGSEQRDGHRRLFGKRLGHASEKRLRAGADADRRTRTAFDARARLRNAG